MHARAVTTRPHEAHRLSGFHFLVDAQGRRVMQVQEPPDRVALAIPAHGHRIAIRPPAVGLGDIPGRNYDPSLRALDGRVP